MLSSDVEAAKDFYTQVFGWAYESMPLNDGAPYWVIQGGGESEGLGGLMARPADVPAEVPDNWGVYFTVADLDATIAALTASGAQVVFGPEEMAGVGRFATAVDPQGGAFSIIQSPA